MLAPEALHRSQQLLNAFDDWCVKVTAVDGSVETKHSHFKELVVYFGNLGILKVSNVLIVHKFLCWGLTLAFLFWPEDMGKSWRRWAAPYITQSPGVNSAAATALAIDAVPAATWRAVGLPVERWRKWEEFRGFLGKTMLGYGLI